ncbi:MULTISPECIES: ABC transporter ATP-binding protein [Pseudoalteromonas]|uniref:ABC-type antimicrobial peptide transport system, ATPase component n=2 Tax=Pseudoalteromonas TaxID=53246 RepID=V4I5C5_PSEL2|nr:MULTISPECIES: ABC transporter ATP-binding protein [Pseudoalteromonas]ESP95439.1 ABC-type antimicrobial peptide transport system, ATPase component [Pseudoalteromonas luteoviolacea 2ta16]KZN31164.1 phosphonate ABC transporter ATP-binding protein [Pseudoalteromonas luteoviolacea NCIMB 1944]MBQ4836267.1 ABC transporter ATP-binding protein [Pseudoalteromonas luteoviolacea]MCG7548414.1 ABC transporter ATP-binding protein [Pseudoalteromonas sp. Of7M-16]MDK2594617.1 ABC transporter ATP-binding prot
MLKMRGVAKSFTTDTVKTQALQPFDLDIQQGEFVAVVGPSGSGKTTFLNIAGLLEEHSQGQYLLDNQDTTGLSDKHKSSLRNQKIGFIFQSFNLIPELNLFDNVEMPLRYRDFSAKERTERVLNALEQVGLAGRKSHYPQQLSGGQQQRVAIARALAGSPSFLLADEPTGNLDSKMADGIMALLKDINKQGTSILMVTHDMEQAQQAGRIVEIRDGNLSEQKHAISA